MRPRSARHLAFALSATLVTALAGCASDRAPTGPAAVAPPELGRAAFLLTIDVASGHITVGRPAVQSSRSEGPALSLVGSEAIALQATACTWGVAANPRQKRCTFGLAIQNQLSSTDLTTPTTFPQPTLGVNGILVFPYVAASLGVPGGGATPTADWDNPPANFFNDFGGCGAKSSDCYRSETFPVPLYGGETSPSRTVGFDVDKNAHSVSVYVVVAADLRDNPVQTVRLAATEDLCGYLLDLGSHVELGEFPEIRVGDESGLFARGFCSFRLPPPPIRVEAATLALYQTNVFALPYEYGRIEVDHLDFGGTLDPADFLLSGFQAGVISSDPTLGTKTLDVKTEVQSDYVYARMNSQFRFVLVPYYGGVAVFAGPGQAGAPELILSYRRP